jgi:hypothetical protein
MKPKKGDSEGLFREVALCGMPTGAAQVFRSLGSMVYLWGLEYSKYSLGEGPVNRVELKAILADLENIDEYLVVIATHGGDTAPERRLARVAEEQQVKLAEIIKALSEALRGTRRRKPKLLLLQGSGGNQGDSGYE